jgi:hypothetical protein
LIECLLGCQGGLISKQNIQKFQRFNVPTHYDQANRQRG